MDGISAARAGTAAVVASCTPAADRVDEQARDVGEHGRSGDADAQPFQPGRDEQHALAAVAVEEQCGQRRRNGGGQHADQPDRPTAAAPPWW